MANLSGAMWKEMTKKERNRFLWNQDWSAEDEQNNYSRSSNTRIGKNETNRKVKDKGKKKKSGSS